MALDALALKAEGRWNPRKESEATTSLGLFSMAVGEVLVDVKLEDVRKVIARSLKPNRKIVDVVKFEDGKIIEETGDVAESKEAKAGASVAQPILGCPEPRFSNAELRAREVLQVFTTFEQQEDFTKTNSFVSQGEGTGHRYMVTSRHARGQLAAYRRQLYDLDEQRPYCVHDYTVPAAEEMLALHLLLQLPQGERYLRHLH